MSEIRRILIVPEEGDPHGLLKEGPCGARPPTVVKVGDVWLNPWVRPTDPDVCTVLTEWAFGKLALPTALVLAWDGEPVAEVQPYIERAGIDYALLAPFVTYALKGMDIGQGPWPGTLVLLDAEGQEVSDE